VRLASNAVGGIKVNLSTINRLRASLVDSGPRVCAMMSETDEICALMAAKVVSTD
jgi:hypothetical protein